MPSLCGIKLDYNLKICIISINVIDYTIHTHAWRPWWWSHSGQRRRWGHSRHRWRRRYLSRTCVDYERSISLVNNHMNKLKFCLQKMYVLIIVEKHSTYIQTCIYCWWGWCSRCWAGWWRARWWWRPYRRWRHTWIKTDKQVPVSKHISNSTNNFMLMIWIYTKDKLTAYQVVEACLVEA